MGLARKFCTPFGIEGVDIAFAFSGALLPGVGDGEFDRLTGYDDFDLYISVRSHRACAAECATRELREWATCAARGG